MPHGGDKGSDAGGRVHARPDGGPWRVARQPPQPGGRRGVLRGPPPLQQTVLSSLRGGLRGEGAGCFSFFLTNSKSSKDSTHNPSTKEPSYDHGNYKND